MSSPHEQQAELVQALSTAGRELSTATLLFHQTVAERAGLNAADHKYIDILLREGSMPAGRLAEQTGLTSGAVTGIIDRLEEAGLVRRTKDPDDRRKVIVELIEEETMRRIGPLFEPMGLAMAYLNARYSDEELAIILDYMKRCTAVLHEQTRKLREEHQEPTP